MRSIILFISVVQFSGAFSQSPEDKMSVANDSLDSMIYSIIGQYQQEGTDFVLLRSYDAVIPMYSDCHFIFRVDSCSGLFARAINDNFDVSFIHVRRIGQKPNDCLDDITRIEDHLSDLIDYFRSDPPILDFSAARYTLYGKINDKYLFETFDESFVAKHHPGMLYQVICNYFGIYCAQ